MPCIRRIRSCSDVFDPIDLLLLCSSSIRGSVRSSVHPSVSPSVGPSRLPIFGGFGVLRSTAWPILALVTIQEHLYKRVCPSVHRLISRSVRRSVTPLQFCLRMLSCLIHPWTISPKLEVPIANSPLNHRPLFSLQFTVSRQASGDASVYPPGKTVQNIIGLDAKERMQEASRRILINIIAATC